MTFAQRSTGESHQKTSEYLKEDVRPMFLHWANVRRGPKGAGFQPTSAGTYCCSSGCVSSSAAAGAAGGTPSRRRQSWAYTFFGSISTAV